MGLHDVVPVLDTVVEDTVVDRHRIEDAHDRVIEVPKDVAGVWNAASKQRQSININTHGIHPIFLFVVVIAEEHDLLHLLYPKKNVIDVPSLSHNWLLV